MAKVVVRSFARLLTPLTVAVGRTRFRLRGSSLARQAARRRALTLLLAALVSLSVYHSLDRAESTRAEWGETVTVAKVNGAVESGDILTDSMVEIVAVPRALVPANALDSIPVGRRARVPLERGEVLTAAKISQPGAGSIAARLEPGFQAVTVPLGESPSPLSPGDRVDLYGQDRGARDPSAVGMDMVVLARGAQVMALSDSAATLAVTEREVAATVAGTSTGTLRIVIIG